MNQPRERTGDMNKKREVQQPRWMRAMVYTYQDGTEQCCYCGRLGGVSHHPRCLRYSLRRLQMEPISSALYGDEALKKRMDDFNYRLGNASGRVLVQRGTHIFEENDVKMFCDEARQLIMDAKKVWHKSVYCFDALTDVLRQAGYKVKVRNFTVRSPFIPPVRARASRSQRRATEKYRKVRTMGKYAEVKGKGIRAMFATIGAPMVWSEWGISRFDNQIVAKNAQDEVPWHEAPIAMQLSRNPQEIMAWLRFLGTRDGYRGSVFDNIFPNEENQRIGQLPPIT